jgi:hypothetical protein
MTFNKLIAFTQKVADAADQLTGNPAETKAIFDKAPEELRTYFNNLVDALKSTATGDSGAKNTGATAISGLTGTDVQTLIESLKNTKADNAQPSMVNATLVAPLVPDQGRGIRYYKDTLGRVNVYIDVDFQADRLTAATLTTLPAGYIPVTQVDDFCQGFNNAIATIGTAALTIDTSGNIKIGTPSSGMRWIHKVIQFRTDV